MHPSIAPSDGALSPGGIFKYKSLLHEHAQTTTLQLPVYQTVNLGSQHEPQFKSTVTVNGETFESSNTFTRRKEAEQDVARIAFECISRNLKTNSVSCVQEDTVFCKSILYEYSVKMKITRPIYTTFESKELFPVFMTSVAFDGKTYTGSKAKTKKVAEQIAARAAIQSILGSGMGNTLPQIIMTKGKLYDEIYKGNSSCLMQDVGLLGNVNSLSVDSIAKAKDMRSPTANAKSSDVSYMEPLSSGQRAEASAIKLIHFEPKNPKEEVCELIRMDGNEKSSSTLLESDPAVANESQKIGSRKTRKRHDTRIRARAKRARNDGPYSMNCETVSQVALPVKAEAVVQGAIPGNAESVAQ